jgi:carbamate kinase
MKRVIAVLGGNAFVPPGGRLTMAGQFRFAHDALAHLKPLLRDDMQLVISHGNGPQVGHILIRVEEALGKAYRIPLEVCVAESEGELGYVLEQSLHNVIVEQGLRPRPIAGLLTQVVVDADDPAFANPTKPIGPYYDPQQADELNRQGFVVRDDAGRGLRRVVASPQPREIVEAGVIERLLEMGVLVIAAGGGGIPVVRENGRFRGVEAVIDKDLAAALLGEVIRASLLVILTGVPCAYRDFGTDRQQPLPRLSVQQAEQLAEQGHFAPGSMAPKIAACVQFARQPGCKSVICEPASLEAALTGGAGTTIEAAAH